MTPSIPTPNDSFSVAMSVQEGLAVVIITGEFDLAVVAQFWAEVESLPPEARAVVVDLRDVSFIDSSGLNALLTLRQTVLASGGEVVLRAPADRVRRLLDLAEVTDLFNIEG